MKVRVKRSQLKQAVKAMLKQNVYIQDREIQQLLSLPREESANILSRILNGFIDGSQLAKAKYYLDKQLGAVTRRL